MADTVSNDNTMLALNAIRLLSILFTAVAMAAGFAHLLALANKIGSSLG